MNKEDILKKKNVVAVGRGCKFVSGKNTGREAVVVFVSEKEDAKCLSKNDIIPQTIDGVETDVIESGEFYALSADHRKKHRPIVGGISGGHSGVGAGTINGFKLGKEIIIVSNNHVLADCNNAILGDRIFQPGKLDGNSEEVGYLIDFVPIKFSGASDCFLANSIVKVCNSFAKFVGRSTRIPQPMSNDVNKVDLAWGSAKTSIEVLTEILGIGKYSGYSFVRVGEKIRKSGRTTGVTSGIVTAVDATAKVNYGGGRVALFDEQFLTTYMSEPGDSGSFGVNKDNELVGLLFAGSSTTTIYNNFDNVLKELGL